MSYMTISSQEKHHFSLCSYFHAHPTTLLLKILGRTNAWAAPPTSNFGGDRPPQSPPRSPPLSAGDNGFIGAGNNHVAANKSNNAKQIQSVILSQTPVQLTGTTERMDFPVESQRTPSPPSQRPPPPPPPLPLGSSHSIRYAKDLRKL